MLSATFSAACEAAAERWQVPALAFGVDAGDRVEAVAAGCDPGTRFHVASVTKPFTALLALGLLDLEAETGTWPPDVRVRHLLSHTSGFDCEHGDLTRFGDGDDALPRLAAELGEVRRFVGVDRAWSYANTGYWLAALLCAEAAGSTYEEALAARILRPAGLEATSFEGAERPGSGPGADAGPYPRARRSSGGLVSNVPDLLRFGRWLLARFGRMRVPRAKPPGGVYGLGLHGERVGGVEVWGHGGSWGGYQSSLLVVPDRDAILVGLTSSGRGKQALRELEDVLFERLLGARRRMAPTHELPRAALEAFAGSFAGATGRADVEVAGDGLRLVQDDGAFAARPVGPSTFEIVDGHRLRDRFDFPVDGFLRSSSLKERVA